MIRTLKRKVMYQLSYVWDVVSTFWKLRIAKRRKRAFLFGCPIHANMGDQAQTYCTLAWLKEHEPEYAVSVFPASSLIKFDGLLLRLIHRYIKDEDKIYMHSGYHLTNLYMLEEEMNRRVVSLFGDRHLVFFPQTVFYTKLQEEALTREAFSKHANISLMCRDKVSHKLAANLFPNARLMLKPDIVTTLIGHFPVPAVKRDGILLCMRDDKESLISGDAIVKLRKQLMAFGTVDRKDTTIDELGFTIIRNREKYLRKIITEFASYRVVVTDRYHGTIFSLVANTPVIIVPTKDHKLTSGADWFPEEFSRYIVSVSNEKEVFVTVRNLLAKRYDYALPDIFNHRYYQDLKKELDAYDARTV